MLSLFILVFVLLTQFLIKHLDRFLGKGLAFSTIFKFIIYNSATILSLAAPMAILVATMMAFGRLSSDNEVTAFKSVGISYFSFLKPGLIFGLLIVGIMIPFNLWVLPEMNHNIRKLSYKISKDRPDIEIKENMLNEIYEKTIYVGDRINSNSFSQIVIFDKNKTTILADVGDFTSLEDGLILDLHDGSIHENISSSKDEYRKTYFDSYKILIPFDKINLDKNKVLIKQDKEMNFGTLLKKIHLKEEEIKKLVSSNEINTQRIEELKIKEQILSEKLSALFKSKGKNNDEYSKTYIRTNQIKTSINNLNNNIKKNNRIIPHFINDINKYNVELHKKFSIPIACLIFIFLGIPLGIISKRGNFSINIAISLGFFIIYWSLLTVGEFLGDEGRLNAALSMWLGNIFIGTISIYLFYISTTENKIFGNKLTLIKNMIIKEK